MEKLRQGLYFKELEIYEGRRRRNDSSTRGVGGQEVH